MFLLLIGCFIYAILNRKSIVAFDREHQEIADKVLHDSDHFRDSASIDDSTDLETAINGKKKKTKSLKSASSDETVSAASKRKKRKTVTETSTDKNLIT